MKGVERKQLNVVLLYKRNAQPDSRVLEILERELSQMGCNIFVDRHLTVGVEWARVIESHIRAADAVVVILSNASLTSEMLQYEVETAADERRKRGRPYILPVKLENAEQLTGSIGALLSELQFVTWQNPEDDSCVVDEVRTAIENSSADLGPDHHLAAAGGAVSPDSVYYVVRNSDLEMKDAIRARESVILIRGPRQVGKTSLIGQGVKLVKELGWHQASTDFQIISSAQLADAELFARMLAGTMAKQLDFKYDFQNEWQDVFGPNINLANFMRELISSLDAPLVWFMDEADRLFHADFGSDFFALVRSWHNARATDPDGPWTRFTVVIAYATEARLFIRNLNQSPFNVGRHVGMVNFTLEQTIELNERYGAPVKRRSDLEALHFLLAGQPFLVRRAFDQLASGTIDFMTLIETADQNDGPFGDHLKRLLVAVSQFPDVQSALRSSLNLASNADPESIEKLVAAGVLSEDSTGRPVPACDLYTQYLVTHLG